MAHRPLLQPESGIGFLDMALSLAAGGIAMALLFLLFARLMRIGELRSLPGLR